MKNVKSLALGFLLVATALISACTETCKVCDTDGRAGVTYRIVDADGVVHDYTTGDDGCVSFDADDCSKYQVVDKVVPEMLVVS